MTVKEAKEMIEELKAQGSTEEELVAAFYGMFTEDKITIDELGDLVQLVGYELTEEFRNMSAEDQKTKGWADEENDSDNDTNNNTDNSAEKAEGNENKEVEGKSMDNNENGSDKAENGQKEDSEDSEEEQRAKAKKLFGLN